MSIEARVTDASAMLGNEANELLRVVAM